MSFFDEMVHKVSDSAKKAVDEAQGAVTDISHGDIVAQYNTLKTLEKFHKILPLILRQQLLTKLSKMLYN